MRIGDIKTSISSIPLQDALEIIMKSRANRIAWFEKPKRRSSAKRRKSLTAKKSKKKETLKETLSGLTEEQRKELIEKILGG